MIELIRQLQTLDRTALAVVAAEAEKLAGEREADSAASSPGRRRPPRPWAARMLHVSEEIKHLSPDQLEALTGAFREWRDKARRADILTSRLRVFGLYLLLRHTGAKPGEIMALNDRADIDLQTGLVRLSSGVGQPDPAEAVKTAREVALCAEVLCELRTIIDHPLLSGLRGCLFHLDQGFVRRKFMERAREIGLPRELANPMVLRHTRAVELLREGAPLHVVQRILGHVTPMVTASYVNFEADDLRRLITFYMSKEQSMQTSARNKFFGNVASVKKGTILSEVEITTTGGFSIVSVITNESLNKLGLAEGRATIAYVKAPWVILVKDHARPQSSARNNLHGVIRRVNQGTIAVEVVLELEDGTEVCALITEDSRKGLDLTVGEKVWATFKAFSVILGTDDSDS